MLGAILIMSAWVTSASSAVSACTGAHIRIAEHRAATWKLQSEMGVPHTRASKEPTIGCRYAQWVADLWEARAAKMVEMKRRMLPEVGDWASAIGVAQRVFPDTRSWLWSCSGAEGGHGRWVTFGGGSYYPGFEDRYVVGGPMQYKWPTFKGHYRHALDYLRQRGFRVPAIIADSDNVRSWLSMTAQALAASWARYTGNDDRHWEASFGNGC